MMSLITEVNELPDFPEKKEKAQEPLTFAQEQRDIDTALKEESTPELNNDLSTDTTQTSSTPLVNADESGMFNGAEAKVDTIGEDVIMDNNESVSSEPEIKSMEDYYKYIGFDKIPERSVKDNKKRIESLERRKKMSLLGEAFKLLVESGGASQGMYVDKREPNPYLTQSEQKIQELYDRDIIEQRRVEGENINDKIRQASDYSRYRSQRDAAKDRAEMQKDSQDYRTNERVSQNEWAAEQAAINDERQLENRKEIIKEQNENNPAYDIEHQRELANIRAESQKAVTDNTYQKKLEYEQEMHDRGLSSSNDKNYEINGQTFTPEQVDVAVAEILNSGVELPEDIQYKLSEGKKLDTVEKLALIKAYLESQGTTEGENGGQAPDWMQNGQAGSYMIPTDEAPSGDNSLYEIQD